MKRNSIAVSMAALGLLALSLLSGCTHSIDVAYKADAARVANAAALEQITVGVAKFEDKRAWVDAGDPKTESFVSQSGPHKFGLTYLDRDFYPVKDMIQDALVKELTQAGIKAKALDMVLSKSSSRGAAELKPDAGDYQIGGQILAFDFNNQAGVWTVTSRRTAIVNFNLYRRGEATPFVEQPISEMDTKEYAMGVAHAVNVETLVNDVFRKVAHEMVQRTAEKLGPTQKAAAEQQKPIVESAK